MVHSQAFSSVCEYTVGLVLRSQLHSLVLVGLSCLMVAACGSRPEIVYIPADETATQIEPVFLGTTRALAAEGFTTERQPGTRFARYGISVPPEREEGAVPYSDSTPDPNRYFLVADQQFFEGAADFQTALTTSLAARPEDERNLILYIHGYNNTFAQSLYRTAQMRYDYQIPGVAVHFSWPSRADARGYVYDGNSVLVARDELVRFLEILNDTRPRRLIIMAHSMGAHLAMEALRTLALTENRAPIDAIDGVVLMSPDIDLDVFRTQAAAVEPLPQPFVIFTSQNDRALRLSAQIAGRIERVGNIDTAADVADLDVTLIDISDFDGGEGDGLNHMVAATSPAVVALVRHAARTSAALEGEDQDPRQEPRFLPGTVDTVRNATQIVLSPLN